MDAPPPSRTRRVVSVSELNRQTRALLEGHFTNLWVEGEISNLSRPASGHWYFTLKDDNAQVRCVMFRRANAAVKSLPGDGDQVLVRGNLSIYEARGSYQIIVERLEMAGEGALMKAFEALKTRLQTEGLFAAEGKREIPASPRRIGVITSPTGAALRDILAVMARRAPTLELTLIPTPVQGETAAAAIVAAIGRASEYRTSLDEPFDAVVLARGGGSLEDLWPFNEEAVARAIAALTIPCISAVGHETDFTIADFVADLRLPTPSAAAEYLSQRASQWPSIIAALQRGLFAAIRRYCSATGRELGHLGARLRQPTALVREQSQRLDELGGRLVRAQRDALSRLAHRLGTATTTMAAASPQRRIERAGARLKLARTRLPEPLRRAQSARRAQLEALTATLQAIGPLAVLGRGYALVQGPGDTLVRRAGELSPGEPIRVRLAAGAIRAQVTAIEGESEGETGEGSAGTG